MPPGPARPPIASPANPLADVIERARTALDAYLPTAPVSAASKAVIADRMKAAEALLATNANLQPTALCVSDTHPGNFLIRQDGRAVFVDLEKPVYGCPALDLAHTVIDVAAGWDPDAGMNPSRDDRAAFVNAWLAAAPPQLAEATAPLITPFRQAVWLRTISFFMRWRAESALQGPWSAERLGPRAAAHFKAHVENSLNDEAIIAAADAWER